MKKLLIDANSLVPYYMTGHTSGIGRSTQELLTALAGLGKLPFEVVLFTRNIKGVSTKGRLPFENTHFYMPNRGVFKRIENGLHLKRMAVNYDLLHIPHNTDSCEVMSKTIFTIHDLIVYRYPKMWNVTPQEKAYFHKVAKDSRAIITCSDSSKKDIMNFWNVPEEKVIAIPWGVSRDTFHQVDSRTFCDSHGIGRFFYFSASCNHPRKNTPLMLEAFDMYLARGGKGQLVLLNPATADVEKYQSLIDKREIIVLHDIQDSELVELYSQAHCSIMASSFEGFGLPVLESLACGTQVLCANNSSLVEAGGNVACFFQELTAENICCKLLDFDGIKKENTLDNKLNQRHLAHFTWERCAEKYAETYEKLLYNI